jgi:uncharacterized protein HemX
MNQNNKPEWFEIAENDAPVVPGKASKTLPLGAFLATALILGIGTVVGQVQEESPATAVEAASAQTVASNETTAVLPVTQIANPASGAVVAATAIHPANPAIATLPTNGDDEDDYDNEDDYEDN